jgi:Protein of unknown function (DUF973)
MGQTVPSADELSGVSRIKWAALLGILALALAIGGVMIIFFDVGLGVTTNISNSGYVSLLRTILLAVALIAVGVILALLSFILYTAGFAALRKADGRFRVPMVLCIIGLIGLACITGFVAVYALSVNTAIACPSSNISCQNNATGSISQGATVVGYVGGLFAFIGLIGLILGLWRFGSRYSSTINKVGAILYIIPVLSVIAPILTLIGAIQVQKKLRNPVMSPPMASPSFPPPPPP